MATVTRTVRLRRTRRKDVRGGTCRIVRVSAVVVAIVVTLVVALPAAAAATAVGVYTYFAKDLPDASIMEAQFSAQSSTNQQYFETTKIYDRTGQTLLYEVIDSNAGDRQWVALPAISPNVISATIALEDRSFWDNPGVDARGLARAFLSNLQGEQVQGASTITQQLIKNTLIPLEERTQISYERKIKEAILAVELTRRYPGREGKSASWNGISTPTITASRPTASRRRRACFEKTPGPQPGRGRHARGHSAESGLHADPDERTAKSRQQIVLNTMADQGLSRAPRPIWPTAIA
jgi:membrane peptidoglycan carboxypeptidase